MMQRWIVIPVIAFGLAIASPGSALAVQPDEILDDPKLEAKARDISAELRCLVCQNQSIDDSDAPLARDLRLLVRERLEEGDSEAEVIDFVVARYGEYVLLRPRFTMKTYVLWFAPILLFGAGVILAYRLVSRSRKEAALHPDPLTPDEKARLNAILNDRQD